MHDQTKAEAETQRILDKISLIFSEADLLRIRTRIKNDIIHAEATFARWEHAAINADPDESSFYEHMDASYWKGRRDALRDLRVSL